MSDTLRAAAAVARSPFRLRALLPIVISLVIPVTAWGDIYKWTDERGRINISNIPPPKSGKAKDVEIVLKETRPTSIPDHVATPTEQALLARIQNLERQVQAPQYAPQTPAAPPPTPYGGYYPPAPPPPPQSYYDSGYDAGYDSGYYPGSYPSYYPSYGYAVVPAYSYAVFPRRTFISRPAFINRPAFAAPRGGSFRGGGGFSHGGGGSFRGGGGHGGGHGGRR